MPKTLPSTPSITHVCWPKRSAKEEQNRQRQAERDRERQERLKAQEAAANDPTSMDQPDLPEEQDSGLVETPEEKPQRQRKPRAPRKPKPAPDEGNTPEAAE